MSDFLDDEPCEFSLQEIEGERVVLRPLCDADAPSLFRLVDESRRFLSEHLPWPDECRSAEDVASRIESWDMQAQMANGACWGVFEKIPAEKSGEPPCEKIAGCIMLGWVQWKHRSATVSFWLGERFCGRGNLRIRETGSSARVCADRGHDPDHHEQQTAEDADDIRHSGRLALAFHCDILHNYESL